MKFKLAYLLVPVLIYTCVLALMWLLQSRMLFHPIAEMATEPAGDNYTFKTVIVNTRDGERLNAWYLHAAKDSPVVLFFHGNAGNISHRIDTLELLVALGANVFIVDYRGYGASSGTPSEDGFYRDAEAAWRHLVIAEGVAAQDIIVFGRSLGGGVAGWLATQVQPGALVLESTFTSIPDLVAEYYPWLPRVFSSALTLIPYRGSPTSLQTSLFFIVRTTNSSAITTVRRCMPPPKRDEISLQ